MLDLSTTFMLFLVVFGWTYVITGSEIGFIVRFGWCWALQWNKFSRYFWALVRCPPCHSWWAGLVVGGFAGEGLSGALQLAFVSCGLVALIQALLGGNGIAAGENFLEAFGLEEKKSDGEG